MCWICDKVIQKGAYRLDYRIKASKALSDQRRIHVQCIGGLPSATRAVDLRALRAFKAAPGVTEEQGNLLEALYFELAHAGTSARSSGL